MTDKKRLLISQIKIQRKSWRYYSRFQSTLQ